MTRRLLASPEGGAANGRPVTAERVLIAILGLLVSGVAFVLGFVGWFQAANVACHGGYECPF